MQYLKTLSLINFSFWISLLISLSSCNDGLLFREKIVLDSQHWTYSNQLQYNWTVNDTLAWYSLQLNIEHDINLDYRNLYVKCFTHFPDGSKKEQVLSLELFNEMGISFGKCNNSTCNTEIVLLPKTKFQFMGEYQLSIEQYGRDSILHGLSSFEMSIHKLKNSNEQL